MATGFPIKSKGTSNAWNHHWMFDCDTDLDRRAIMGSGEAMSDLVKRLDARQIADKIVPPMQGCRVSTECSDEWSKRWQAAHDAAEQAFAALSTDAEPVYEGKHTIPMVRVVTEDDIDIREPAPPAPSVAVKGMNIEDFPNDIFIAEAQRRVTQFSPDEYMSPNQSDDRAKFDILRSRIIVAKVASIHSGENHPVLIGLASLCDELDSIRGNPLPKRAYAINTTFVGKTDIEQDHSPK